MDQRKFITFLLLSMAFWLLCLKLFPPPNPGQQPPAAGAKADGKDAADGKEQDGADKVAANDEKPEAAEQPLAEDEPIEQAPGAAKPGDLQIAKSVGDTQFVTIGSLNPDDGYRMLVTLTSGGAAIYRAELSSPRYTSQQDWSGYLGELHLEDVADGVKVGVVGDGTPAAQAKPKPIAAGDVITGLKNSKPGEVLTVKTFQAALAKRKPGDEFSLQVKSGDDTPQARTVQLRRRPFAVLRPEIENFEMRDAELPANFVGRPSLLMTLPTLNGKPLSKKNAKQLTKLLETGNWQLAARDAKSVTFTITPVPDLTITKRYTLTQVPAAERNNANFQAYHVQLDIEFQNTAQEPRSLAYQLEGPTGMPLEGWWYGSKMSRTGLIKSAGLRDIVVRFAGESGVTQFNCPDIVKGEVTPIQQVKKGLAYAGVDGQYFSAVMIPDKPLEDVWFESVAPIVIPPADVRQPTYANTTVRLTRLPIDLAAGNKHAEKYRVFLGPKRPDLLAEYRAGSNEDYSLADIPYYGWPIFGVVARVMLVILHFFYGIVGNYGIAIILLTLAVRASMFPLSYKQTKSMARMQALKPEIDRINEEHKTDMQKRSQATQELYRKHQINPLAGCLPVLLQLPIFIGLYRALMVDIELRNSPLFGESIRWASDLAAPDKFWNWSHIMPEFVETYFGPYLNIFPLITVALFLVTQKMSMPPPTNEQAAMQQKMMKYMTIFIGFMFYRVPSGLCLYFIVSSLWGIAERKLMPKPQTAGGTAGGATGAAPGSGGKRPSNGGPNGRPRTKKPRKVRPKK